MVKLGSKTIILLGAENDETGEIGVHTEHRWKGNGVANNVAGSVGVACQWPTILLGEPCSKLPILPR